MAYPTVSAPYGFQPINSIGGTPYAGSTRLVPVASGAVYTGDLVEMLSSGTCAVISSGSAAAQCLGVCVGVQYTNSSGQPVQGQYYPASQSTSTALAFGYVVDDPNAVFKVVATNGQTTTPTAFTRAIVGSNVAMSVATGNTTTGDSYYGIDGTSAGTTATLPIRVVDVVPDTATGAANATATTYFEFLVKFNLHQYNDTTGV